MKSTIYFRLRPRIEIPHDTSTIKLKTIATIVAPDAYIPLLNNLVIYDVTEVDTPVIIIDAIDVISHIEKRVGVVDIQTIGPAQAVIEIKSAEKKISILSFLLVWFLLFIGAGLAIMYFHEDVSMRASQMKLYKMITGIETSYPLLFQIPYSIGLGIGMILFFNHLFRKRINKEPSPLEVEMFNYQEDLDRFMIMKEKVKQKRRQS